MCSESTSIPTQCHALITTKNIPTNRQSEDLVKIIDYISLYPLLSIEPISIKYTHRSQTSHYTRKCISCTIIFMRLLSQGPLRLTQKHILDKLNLEPDHQAHRIGLLITTIANQDPNSDEFRLCSRVIQLYVRTYIS